MNANFTISHWRSKPDGSVFFNPVWKLSYTFTIFAISLALKCIFLSKPANNWWPLLFHCQLTSWPLMLFSLLVCRVHDDKKQKTTESSAGVIFYSFLSCYDVFSIRRSLSNALSSAVAESRYLRGKQIKGTTSVCGGEPAESHDKFIVKRGHLSCFIFHRGIQEGTFGAFFSKHWCPSVHSVSPRFERETKVKAI